MVKKLLILVALFLPMMALAQYGTGSWKVHPNFTPSKLQNNIDTGDKVYYLVSNSLYCYDKATATSTALNVSNKLSDITVTAIYYNDAKGYLMLTYDNSNIDIITRDGKLINMPELKDAILSQSKVINHVNFDKDCAWVAGDFGIATIDDTNWTFKETRIYGSPFSSIAHVGKYIVVHYGSYLRIAPESTIRDIETAFVWTNNRRNGIARITPIDDTRFFVNSNDSLEVCQVSEGKIITQYTVARAHAASIQRYPGGFIASFPSAGYYITTDEHGNNAKSTASAAEIMTANVNGDGTIWALNGNGLHRLGDSNISTPNGIGISTIAFWANYNPGDNKFYIASTSDNSLLPTANTGAKTEIWTHDGTQWRNETPANVPLYNEGQDTYQGNYWLNFVPGTENAYVFATRAAGVAHVVNGDVKTTYVSGVNTPLNDKYRAITQFDDDGNLWFVQSYKTAGKTVAVLPRAKLDNPSAVKSSDWYLSNVAGIDVTAFKAASFAISHGTGIKVFCSGAYQKPVIMWNNNGDITNTKPATKSFTQFKDNEGSNYLWDYTLCFFASSDGTVWMGTNSGVVSFNPADAFTPEGLTVNHIRSLSEDGVSTEYLCDGIQVNWITEDNMGRKILGTHTNGVYIVSPNGDRIIKHLTSENSVMQSNCIYNLACNTSNNTIMIVTMNGVCEYHLDSTPAADDYSNVSVYPNPVRPDFTGYLTVSNLMAGSHVSITAPDGKVVKTFVSEGGVFSWDCCDDSGNRVPTGRYTINAAQNPANLAPVSSVLILK